MTVSFRAAVRSDTQILLGLAGPSGSGKTLSALYIADGMRKVTGGEIFGIDTENKRMLHYADELLPYRFKHGEMHEPFSPAAYLDAVKAAKDAGARIIIIDSASHMHEGVGGVLDMHETELTRRAGNDYGKREALKFAAWIEPKRQVNLFVNSVLQIDAHFIFCFRAKDKMAMVRNDRGKMEPVSIGWTPIITDRMEFEMTATLLLPPGARGVPDIDHSPKIVKNLAAMFPAGEALSRETGERLAAWAAGAAGKPASAPEPGQATEQPPPPENAPALDVEALKRKASYQAGLGTETLRDWWKALKPSEQKALADLKEHYKTMATEADRRKADAA